MDIVSKRRGFDKSSGLPFIDRESTISHREGGDTRGRTARADSLRLSALPLRRHRDERARGRAQEDLRQGLVRRGSCRPFGLLPARQSLVAEGRQELRGRGRDYCDGSYDPCGERVRARELLGRGLRFPRGQGSIKARRRVGAPGFRSHRLPDGIAGASAAQSHGRARAAALGKGSVRRRDSARSRPRLRSSPGLRSFRG